MAIQINLTDAVATTDRVKFSLVDNSATYVLESSQGVQLNGTFPFSGLAITRTSVFFSVAPGTLFTGMLNLDVVPIGSAAPVLLVAYLSVDGATVTYPTEQGPETLLLTPGQEMTLSGFIVD